MSSRGGCWRPWSGHRSGSGSPTGRLDCWPRNWGSRTCVGEQDLAPLGSASVAGRDVHVLHRPRVGGQGPRCRRALPHPPDKAVVLCVDEKSQVQALEWTVPILPIRPGIPEKATTISATAPPRCSPLRWPPVESSTRALPRHRHQEFLRFLKQVAKAIPAWSCTWWSTTTPPTSTPPGRPG